MSGRRGVLIGLSAIGCGFAFLAALGVPGAAGERQASRAAGHARIVHLTTRRDAGIFSMSPTGGRRQRLRRGLVDGVSLAASGRRMVFANSQPTPCGPCPADFHVDVFVANGNGRHAHRVRQFRHANLFSLAMSFDGRQVVLSIYRGGDADLYLMRANGEGVRQLTDDRRDQTGPSFSPDGREVVFSQDDPAGARIYAMPVRGGGKRRLTDDGGSARDPVFSPNGRWIAYDGTKGADSGIFLMHSDGRDGRRLTNVGDDAIDFAPDFSPNGRSIVFARGAGIDFDLVTMRVDGSNLRRIRHSSNGFIDPDWTR
ncbi:MAG TPA: hypothetical protein VF176_02630 [Solirubrobacterales bacterium]